MRAGLSAAGAGLCALAVAATSLGAQPPAGDTLPTRRGQWAVEFPVQATYSLGVLNFLTRHTALLLDGSVNVTGDDRESVLSGGTRLETERDVQTGSLRIGVRQYHSVAPKAAGFYQFGMSPTYSRVRDANSYSPDGQSSEQVRTTYSVGAFFGVGGSYFVTPRVTVGMVTNTQLSYRRHKDLSKSSSTFSSSSRTEASGSGYGFSVSSPMIVAALYF